MDQNVRKIGLLNWIVLLLAVVSSVLLTAYVSSAAGWVATIIMGFGFLVAATSYFQMRLEERERLEKLEFDELNKAKGSASLFASDEAESFPARRSREQFERFLIPGFAILLFLAQSAAIYWIWQNLEKSTLLNLDRSAVAMALFAMFGLILFLFGRYGTGLARLDDQRLLRPGANYLLLSSYLCFLVTIALGAEYFGFQRADFYFSRVLVVVLGLITFELLLSLVLEIYRPRVKGRPARLLYESRLVGLLARPERLVTTAAHALDYQFGFKVSETWFYRFLQRAFAWILLLQLTVLLLSTSIVFIEPGEQGLIERFGRPVEGRQVLEPGPHLKFPWPMDKVQRFQTRQIQSFNVGFVPHDDQGRKESTILWTVSHYKEELNMLVASRERLLREEEGVEAGAPPVNLLTVSIPVQYQIGDVRAWAYNHSNAGEMLENLATREVVRYLVSADLNEIMSSARQEAAEFLRDQIQKRADELELGANILFVGLQDIHPPVTVADAYQAVVGAQQEVEAEILKAEAYRARTEPIAEADAQRLIREAEIYRINTVADVKARGERFVNQMTAFAAAPEVYTERTRLEAFTRSAENARKFFISPENAREVFQLNLEEKLRPDLLDIDIPPPN